MHKKGHSQRGKLARSSKLGVQHEGHRQLGKDARSSRPRRLGRLGRPGGQTCYDKKAGGLERESTEWKRNFCCMLDCQ